MCSISVTVIIDIIIAAVFGRGLLGPSRLSLSSSLL